MSRSTPLVIGSLAPDFTLPTLEGGEASLKDVRGAKAWLAFFRYASCPLCNLRIHEMIRRHARYAASGLQVLAVFQSPRGRMRKYVGAQQPPFPLLSDPDERVYALYGVGSSLLRMTTPSVAMKLARAAALGYLPGVVDGTLARLPADFLIDADGVIRDIFHGGDIGDHIPLSRVEAFIAGPREG